MEKYLEFQNLKLIEDKKNSFCRLYEYEDGSRFYIEPIFYALLENFKVKKIILNNGEINTYEKKLQEYKNKITKEYNSKINIKFLNTKIYDNENDNSIVGYLNIHNIKFLYMGDASINVEKKF